MTEDVLARLPDTGLKVQEEHGQEARSRHIRSMTQAGTKLANPGMLVESAKLVLQNTSMHTSGVSCCWQQSKSRLWIR